MSLTVLFDYILSTIEIFFSSTAGILFAYSFFRTHKAAKKEYIDSVNGSLFAGPAYKIYEEDNKYYVSDLTRKNKEEISKEDYFAYRQYEKFDFGLESSLMQVKKDRILAVIALLFIFVSSGISINKITKSIIYTATIDTIYLFGGIACVIIIKALVDRFIVKEPVLPESIKAFEKKYCIIETFDI